MCGLASGATLLGTRSARAEVDVAEVGGWTFFTDGRINAFVSQGFGNDFPQPNPNPHTVTDSTGAVVPGPDHDVNPGNGFTSAFYEKGRNDSYLGTRVRNGFVGGILGFGMKSHISSTTTAKGYVALWGQTQTVGRDRTNDYSTSVGTFSPLMGFDVREGYVQFDGDWGTFTAGRMLGIFGRISTEIDFNYGHNYGVGYPCSDVGDSPACGQIGTGVMFPGFGAGFMYSTPSFGGLKLHAGFYDPVRILGGWNRAPIVRPEGSVTYENHFSSNAMFKLAVEGLVQQLAREGADITDTVWGVAGGGRLEVGVLRFGASVFRGKGLGQFYALQNSAASFSQNSPNLDLRSFTGLYAQAALVFGPLQISAGAGRVTIDQLEVDKTDYQLSNAKDQIGVSLGVYYSLTDYFALGLDYFRFQADWYGAPYFTTGTVSNPGPTAGFLPAENQVVNFINAGATFHW